MKRITTLFLLLFIFLFTNIKFSISQCDDCKDIKKEYDSFDEKYITTVSVGNLSGGNFLNFTNAGIWLKQYASKTDTSYYFKFYLTIPQTLIFLVGEESLVFKCDKEKISFKTIKSDVSINANFNYYDLLLKIEIDKYIKIINSKEVTIRVYSSNGYLDRDFSFDEDYFSCFKCFYNSYIIKKIK